MPDILETKKRCCRCKSRKPLSDFYRHCKRPDGLSDWCKDCDKLDKLHRKAQPKEHITEKRCKQCKEVLTIEHFNKDVYTRDGFSRLCKKCVAIKRRASLKANQKLVAEKRCFQCGIVKPQQEFYKKKSSFDGLSSQCKVCQRLQSRILYAVHQAEKHKIDKYQNIINNRERADEVIREMAELQVAINREKTACQKRVVLLKEDAARTIKPYLFHQTSLQLMLEVFVKKNRKTCQRVVEEFRFGRMTYLHNKMDILLDVVLAEQKMGLP